MNDFVVIEMDKVCKKPKETTENTNNSINNNVYQELINESSNTNYSMEDEDDESKIDSKSMITYFGKVCSICTDNGSLLIDKIYFNRLLITNTCFSHSSTSLAYEVHASKKACA